MSVIAVCANNLKRYENGIRSCQKGRSLSVNDSVEKQAQSNRPFG
jgi:hypothetical protein